MKMYSRIAPIILVIVALVFVSVEALTRRPGAISIEASSHERQKLNERKDPVAFLVSAPRGGEVDEESKGGIEAEIDNEEEEETEVEEESSEEIVEEYEEAVPEDSEDEEFVEEVVEEAAEEHVAENLEEEIDEAEIAVDAEEEEEEVVVVDEEETEVVFPTDEIPSDDVRSFHTTDGELADDEGVYTDGQNESPITAEETIGATEEPADGGDDDDEEEIDEDEQESAYAEATAVRAGASVTVIDEDLKNILITDLQYTEEDVTNMRPELAQEVVGNKLARPIEGMPRNWYIDPELAVKQDAMLAKKKGLIVTVAMVGAVALSVGVLKENDTIGDTVEEIVDALKEIPKAIVAMVVAAKSKVTGGVSTNKKSLPAATPPPAAEEPKEEEEEADELETKDASVHSIKPGTTPKEVPDPNLDTTWLDKLITKIGSGFKSFLNIKI